MRVAILLCDEVMEKFQPQFGQYRDMIAGMFSSIQPPCTFDSFDCQQGHYPDDPDLYDFFITTGSRASVYEEKPWINRLISYIKQLDQGKKKLIGICFGHQLIAMALGGRVEKSARGWGIGIATNTIVAHPDWMKEQVRKLHILASHQDQVTALPEGALIIATSDFCPYFMVQWNHHFLSIQGHPEWVRDYSRKLMDERRAIIPHDCIEAGLSSLHQKPDNPLFVRWIVDFVTGEEPLCPSLNA